MYKEMGKVQDKRIMGIYTSSNRKDPLAEETRFSGFPGWKLNKDFQQDPVNPMKLANKMVDSMAYRSNRFANQGAKGTKLQKNWRESIKPYSKLQQKYGGK